MKGESMKRLIIILLAVGLSGSMAFAGGHHKPSTTNVNINTQHQNQDQRQLQLQLQNQWQWQDLQNNNNQTIAPSQSVVIEAPERPLLQTPIVIPNLIPQLSFGEVEVVSPIITDARLREWKGEIIISIVDQEKTTVGKMIKKTVELVNDAGRKEDLTKCRIICLSHPSTKMWSTGGSMTVGGSNTVGTGGMSGAGGLFPSYGRMTADTVIDIVIVRVVN